MVRVSKEMIDRLEAFFDLLPDEANGKCALCNDTCSKKTWAEENKIFVSDGFFIVPADVAESVS